MVNSLKALKTLMKSWGSFAVFVFLVFCVRASFADHYLVPSGSMLPSLHIGDRLLVDKSAYDLRIPLSKISVKKTGEPKRGDVVVFVSPEDNKTIMVKRLIAIPGDRIEVDNGFVKINGKSLSIQAITKQNEELGFQLREQNQDKEYQINRVSVQKHYDRVDKIVPKDHYFMMGDNRDNSWDSRGWGFVPRENLLGRAERVAFSAQIFNWPPAVNLERTWVDL